MNSELDKHIKDKGFTNFWEMFMTLNHDWGYNFIEAFGICLNYYNDTQIWEDVAFINAKRLETMSVNRNDPYMDGWVHNTTQNKSVSLRIEIGVLNEKTKHLKGLFDFCLKQTINESLWVESEVKTLHNLCDERYTFIDLPYIVVDYLTHTFEKYHGNNIKALDLSSNVNDLIMNEIKNNIR